MTVKPFFPVFIVLVGVVLYAYFAPQKRPEKATTLTPKEYIEMVEKGKAERLNNTKKHHTQAAEATSPNRATADR